MKRNWDTIRELLTRVETCTLPTEMIGLEDFPPEKQAEVSYHMVLLIEAGMIKGKAVPTFDPGPQPFIAQRLTWEGHEFLDAIRSEAVWEKTKRVFAEKGLDMAFDLVKEVAKSAATSLLGS